MICGRGARKVCVAIAIVFGVLGCLFLFIRGGEKWTLSFARIDPLNVRVTVFLGTTLRGEFKVKCAAVFPEATKVVVDSVKSQVPCGTLESTDFTVLPGACIVRFDDSSLLLRTNDVRLIENER